MTRDELIRKLMKIANPKSRVDLVIIRGDDEIIYTEASDVRIARDHRGRDIVEITN